MLVLVVVEAVPQCLLPHLLLLEELLLLPLLRRRRRYKFKEQKHYIVNLKARFGY